MKKFLFRFEAVVTLIAEHQVLNDFRRAVALETPQSKLLQ
jgi:hypothetical protein